MGTFGVVLSVIFGLICVISLLKSTLQLSEDEELEKAGITAQEIFISSFILLVITIIADIIF